MITPDILRQVAPNAGAHADLFAGPLSDAADRFDISSDIRVAAWLAQLAQESGEFHATVENLNYSAEALQRVWPHLFPDGTADQYAHKPEAIADRAYAGRLGNGDEASGDGWTYRGRGLIQITGKANYAGAGEGLGLDLVGSPELLEQPENAAASAGWFWSAHGLNALADAGDIITITRRINGGVDSLAQRMTYWERAKAALGLS